MKGDSLKGAFYFHAPTDEHARGIADDFIEQQNRREAIATAARKDNDWTKYKPAGLEKLSYETKVVELATPIPLKNSS